MIASMEEEIFKALFKIVTFLNDPKQDRVLLARAGIKNTGNLLPVIVRVNQEERISVGELADQLGKNHSSTSRQVDRFEAAGLLRTQPSAQDNRVREVSLTVKGQQLADRIAQARMELMSELLQQLTIDQQQQIKASLQLLVGLMK